MATTNRGKNGDIKMWKLRGCPRCQGDVFLDSEEHIWFEHCLQCGYTRELKSIDEFGDPSLWPVKEGPAPSLLSDNISDTETEGDKVLAGGRRPRRRARARTGRR